MNGFIATASQAPPAQRSISPPHSASLLSLFLLAAACGDAGSGVGTSDFPVAEVVQGPLAITVVEGGLLQSSNPVIIRSTIEGRNAILEIVQEGSRVKRGDVVVVLDTATLVDRLNLQEIEVEAARSELAQAEEALSIQVMQNQENEATARCARELAEQALQAYKEGTIVQERRRLQSALMLAQEKLARAKSRAEASRRLERESFLSRADLEADELAEKQAEEEVKLVKGDLDLLEQWTAKGEILRLETALNVAEIALKRVIEQCRSEAKQREDARNARLRSYELKKAARDKLVAQIEQGTIRAPVDGLVVYAVKDWDEAAIAKGTEVREREEIAYLPDLSDMVVAVDIHETSVPKLEQGQHAWIQIEAHPNRKLPGTLAHVSVVPATVSSRWNPDLKVYKTVVHLDELIDGLKPGMHAQVEILVEEIPDAVQVPLQAVRQVGSMTFVYLRDDTGDAVLREVSLGPHGLSRVQITEGLKPGEVVFLTVPPGAPVPALAPAEPEPPPLSPEGGEPGGSSAATPGSQNPKPDRSEAPLDEDGSAGGATTPPK